MRHSKGSILNLISEKNAIDLKIKEADIVWRQLGDELKALEAEQKGLSRKQRTHRLITRGGMLEAFLQKPLLLSDEQVYALLKVIFHKPEVDNLLKRMIAESERKLLEDADPAGDPTE